MPSTSGMNTAGGLRSEALGERFHVLYPTTMYHTCEAPGRSTPTQRRQISLRSWGFEPFGYKERALCHRTRTRTPQSPSGIPKIAQDPVTIHPRGTVYEPPHTLLPAQVRSGFPATCHRTLATNILLAFRNVGGLAHVSSLTLDCLQDGEMSTNLPTVDLGDNTVLQVAAGQSHTCVLLASGDVACWGFNEYGQASKRGSGR